MSAILALVPAAADRVQLAALAATLGRVLFGTNDHILAVLKWAQFVPESTRHPSVVWRWV